VAAGVPPFSIRVLKSGGRVHTSSG
jgi:hypothetical protein